MEGYLSNLPTTKTGLINPSDGRFYYLKDTYGNKRVTVCLGNDNGTPVRGIALCSLEDKLNKNTGRKLAYVRMRQALKHQNSTDKIVLGGKGAQALQEIKGLAGISFKSEYDANVNEFEDDLITDLAV